MYSHISGREQYPDIGVVSAAPSNSIIEETDTVTLFKLQGETNDTYILIYQQKRYKQYHLEHSLNLSCDHIHLLLCVHTHQLIHLRLKRICSDNQTTLDMFPCDSHRSSNVLHLFLCDHSVPI